MAHTLVRLPLQKSSGRCKGSITSSFRAAFTFSRAPIWSNFTPTSFGGITADINAFSYSSSATVCKQPSGGTTIAWSNIKVPKLSKVNVFLLQAPVICDGKSCFWRSWRYILKGKLLRRLHHKAGKVMTQAVEQKETSSCHNKLIKHGDQAQWLKCAVSVTTISLLP